MRYSHYLDSFAKKKVRNEDGAYESFLGKGVEGIS